MDEVKPIKLPLDESASRCLGHGNKKGEWCKRINECARHATISHPDEPWVYTDAPYYTMCSSDDYHCFLEIDK